MVSGDELQRLMVGRHQPFVAAMALLGTILVLFCACILAIWQHFCRSARSGSRNRFGAKPLEAGRETTTAPLFRVVNADVTTAFDLHEPPLGRGAYGRVHSATCHATGRSVAVKLIARNRLSAADGAALVRELSLLCSISHPNIIALHRSPTDGVARVYQSDRGPAGAAVGEIAIVTELAAGGEVLQRIAGSADCYSEADAARVLHQLIKALAYLHERGIAHRDIKPENILYSTADTDDATVKLVDFGFARRMEPRLHEVVGTLPFMAPELFRAARQEGGGAEGGSGTGVGEGKTRVRIGEPCCDYDVKVDIYAAGVVAHMLLVGRFPLLPARPAMVSDWERLHAMRDSGPYARMGATSSALSLTDVESAALSSPARSLLRAMLATSPADRRSAQQLLDSPTFGKWLDPWYGSYNDKVANSPPPPPHSENLRQRTMLSAGPKPRRRKREEAACDTGALFAYDSPLPREVCSALSSTLGARREAMMVLRKRTRRAKEKRATLQRKDSRKAKWSQRILH